MQFHSQEEHEESLKSVIEEYRTAKKIQDLQEARVAGCRTSAEANKFIEQKRKMETEENAQRLKESGQAGPSGNMLLRPNSPKGEVDVSPGGIMQESTGLQRFSKDSSSTITSSPDFWDVNGFQGADLLLSDTEKRLCGEIRILPSLYENAGDFMIMKGDISKKSEARNLFKVEPNKVDRVYEMLVKKGVAQA